MVTTLGTERKAVSAMTVAEIIEGLRRLLEEHGYCDDTIRFYVREWGRLSDWLVEEYGDDEFDMARGAAYLEAAHGVATDYDAKELSQHKLQLVRVVHLLEDYKLHGVLTRRFNATKNPIRLSGAHLRAHGSYAAALSVSGLAASTTRTYGSVSRMFLDYLVQRGIAPSDVTAADVEAYARTLAGFTHKTVEQQMCGVRHLLRHLQDSGVLGSDVASEIHVPPAPRAPHVPSSWDPDDLRAVLDAVDRGVPLGKRDYAMLLVACVLGLRGSDIKGLRFGDFDWRAGRLRIVQRKTGRPLELPVPDAVAWAIIDYARNGRPSVAGEDHVFVSHRPPFRLLGDDNHLAQILTKYMRKAGVSRAGRRCGFHSLRHTAGALMLEEGTPLPVIASVLGHADVDVTATYLKVDVDRLRECVLGIPGDDEDACEGEGGEGDARGDE